MSPPVATASASELRTEEPIYFTKKTNGVNGNGVLKTDAAIDVLEDYNGNYRFAPIEEAEVSRAMIKRCASPLRRHMRSLINFVMK